MNSTIRLSLLSVCAGIVFLLTSVVTGVQAQPVLSAKNISLGGGGTAYLNGYEANFYNPANLMIRDREGKIHFGIGTVGMFYEPVESTDDLHKQFDAFKNVYLPYAAGSEQITDEERQTILEDDYGTKDLVSQHQTRTDAILGGLQWQGEDKAYSVALRARSATRIEVGRGWYSSGYIDNNSQKVRDFRLQDQHQELYELSLGYAQEFEFINGLIPRISKLYIGFAPKFVISGNYQNALYRARYATDSTGSVSYVHQMNYQSSGTYSRVISDYMSSGDINHAIAQNMDRTISFDPTGYGLGFDFGLTYLIPLGDDVSVMDDNHQKPIDKSIRLSFSMTDLGVMWYNKSPLTVTTAQDSTAPNSQNPLNIQYVGAPGQFPAYFDNASALPNPFLNTHTTSASSFRGLLPTSINAGALIDLNRLKLMGDLTLGLDKTAFTDTRLTVRLGIEAKAFSVVPLRFGTQFAAGRPVQMGLGTGIETRYFDFDISSLILVRSQTLTTEINGGAVAGLQFHI